MVRSTALSAITTPQPGWYSSTPHHASDGLRQFIDAEPAAFLRTWRFRDFYDALDTIESQRVERLWQAHRGVELGAAERAAEEAEALVRAMPDEEDGAGAIAVRTFGEALLGRIRKSDGHAGNLYLGARAPGAQLRAFELLRVRTPLIPFAYAAGNRALLETITEPSHVTLIDVGIGRGGQVRALLRNPASRRAFKSLHVVGVEPDSSSLTGGGALETARQNVLSTGEELGIDVRFTAIAKTAEDLTVADLKNAGLHGIVIANSAFCLHHVRVDEANDRDAVLRTLRAAGIGTMVIVEPDSNHYEDRLGVRFLHAYRHYRTIAKGLQTMLAPGDATLVWNEFFAPEIHNVITHDGALRTERHEESARWSERFVSTGWRTDALTELLPHSATPPGYELRTRASAFCLSYQGVSVLAVVRARA